MLPSFCRQEITRVRPGLKVVRGSSVPDWSASKVDVLVIGGCSVQPASTSLSQDGRVQGITEGLTAYLPEGSDVRAGDHIIFEGETFVINGDPKKWEGCFSRSSVQLSLIRWEG